METDIMDVRYTDHYRYNKGGLVVVVQVTGNLILAKCNTFCIKYMCMIIISIRNNFIWWRTNVYKLFK